MSRPFRFVLYTHAATRALAVRSSDSDAVFASIEGRLVAYRGRVAQLPSAPLFRLALAALARMGGAVSNEEATQHMFGADANGGPTTANVSLRLRRGQLHAMCATLGLAYVAGRGHFRIAPLQVAA